MLIARTRKRTVVAATEADDVVAACNLPQSSEFKLPVGCSITAEENCQWTIDCKDSKVVELKERAS